jgi:hypothetical protein
MEVEIDSKTVFTGPFDCFEEVRPANFGKEWFPRIDFDRPEGKWNTDPVQTGSSDLSEIFLGDKRVVMVLDGAEVAVTGLDESMEGPFVDGVGIEWFVEGRSDKGFDD